MNFNTTQSPSIRTNIGEDDRSGVVQVGELWNAPGQVVTLGNMTHNGGLEYSADMQNSWGRTRGSDEFVLGIEGGYQIMVARSHFIDIGASILKGRVEAKRIQAYQRNLMIGQPWAVTLEDDGPVHTYPVESLILRYSRHEARNDLPEDPTFVTIEQQLGRVGIVNLDAELHKLYRVIRGF